MRSDRWCSMLGEGAGVAGVELEAETKDADILELLVGAGPEASPGL